MKGTELKVSNPYVGPRPFEERHQRRFFGRDWEADELVSLVVAHPAVLLYAQSGAGKTSLINAKLIPLLRDKEGLQVMPVARVGGELPKEVRPEQIEDLFVFNTLLDWMKSGADPAQLVGLSLSAFLEGQPRSRAEEGQPTLRVVIFDQFEELFTLYPERWAEREGFFAQVADALSEDPFLRVLFVLREDCLAQLDPYVALLPERLRTRFRLERLRREAALAAVKGPLAGTERSFASGVAESLVQELLKIRVETKVGGTVEVPGEFVEPVQLQVVCQSLWEELPPDVTEITQLHLRAFGNVDQALLTFYERALRGTVQRTGAREGKLRTWFERDLITPMGTRGTVYRAAEFTGGVPNVAIDVLESQHLIRAERRAGARWYELTHDRFIGPIQRSNEAWRAARRERWLWITGSAMASLILLIFFALLGMRGSEQSQALALQATVAAQETAAVQAGAKATAAEATATAAFDSKTQATAAFHAWQTAQVQATAASRNLQAAQAQATPTATRPVAVTPQPGGAETPSLDPTAIAAVETATAAAQSLQIAEQKALVAAAEFKATATAAAAALTGKIAFTLWNGVKYDVWVANVDGSGRTIILGEMRQPAFSPDGSKIAVNGEAPYHMNLHVADANGSDLIEVSEHLEDSRPSWSPDGYRIVFDSTVYGDRRSRIYILDDVTRRTEEHVLRSAGRDTLGWDPFWLPDGRVVYNGCDYWASGASCGLYIVPPDGSAIPTQLTTDSSDTAPAAHGNKVTFMSIRDGNWEIYSINTDGSGLKRLTNNDVNDGLPTFSPNGQFIAFVSDEGGNWAIWAMNADGSSRRKLFDLDEGYGIGEEYDWTTERISWAP